MDIKQWLTTFFKTTEFELVETDKGLTNKNYLLTMNQQRYMVRVPYEDAHHIVERSHEGMAMELIKGHDFDCETFYYDEHSGIKISYYLSEVSEYQECTDPQKIEKVAHLLKRFHALDLQSPESFKPYERYLKYKSNVKYPLYDLSQYEAQMQETCDLNVHQCLCHNDLVSGNLLFDQTKTYLIDYEYAANNDPLFDVISFLSENDIFDSSLRARFYQIYFDELTDAIKKRLLDWEIFQDVLWCTWAMMMVESRQESIYHKIAKSKYEALMQLTMSQ